MNDLNPLVSVVVIGRNEGERLRRCLASVKAADWSQMDYELIYVDSQSTDTSLTIASGLGARCFSLTDQPLSAAKARNLGTQMALGALILFLDGDTILEPEFIPRAVTKLRSCSRICAVWGNLRELDPAQSIYTRVMDLDWIYPVGDMPYFGGNALVLRQAIESVGGFNENLRAGEEPELGGRLREAGWQIMHIDVPMAKHDLGIRDLKPWVIRAFRSGVAYAQIKSMTKHRPNGQVWQREGVRDLVHGIAYTLLVPIWIGMTLWRPETWWVIPVLVAGLVLRTAWRARWRSNKWPLLLAYAIHTHLQKIPALMGQISWHLQRDVVLNSDAVFQKEAASRSGR